jgi:hypothetical protein
MMSSSFKYLKGAAMGIQPNQILSSAAISPGATPSTARKGWFSRNWKWLVPTLLIIFFVLPLAVIGSVFAAMKNSDAARESLRRAQKNALVLEKLGTPIEEGWMVSGSINTSTTSGDADLAVPISGPKGRGKIFVTAHKNAGVWDYQVMLAAIEGSDQRINLLSDVAGGTLTQPVSDASAQQAQGTLPAETQPAVPASLPADPPASSSVAAPPPAEQAGVIQTQETNQEGTVGELTECRRSEGVLTIKVRFRNTSTKRSHLTFVQWNAPGDNEKFYVTAGNKKYFMLKDSEGTYLSSNSASNPADLNLEPGQTFLWWGKYPAPSADVKKINFMMPVTPPFEGLPITDK